MPAKGIILLGLGPGRVDQLTLQAWRLLENAQEIYLRTSQHPLVKDLPPGLAVHSFDHFYEEGQTFEEVYERIVARVIELGSRPQGVIYAVPGHPLIAETTAPQVIQRARQLGIPLQVVEGLSFLEPACTALGLDPVQQTVLVDALELLHLHVPPFPTNTPALIAQIHSREVASDLKLTLMSLYPDEHPVRLVHAAGTEAELVEDIPLYGIDRSPHIGLLTCLYLPPLAHETAFEAFLEVVAHLRSPQGCPWDREQTYHSLRSDLLEEAYEALSALDAEDPQGMREELGDLILIILLLAQIAAENGDFSIADVLQGIHTKIVRRHPHVFGDLSIGEGQEVLRNWERLKAQERQENGKQESSLLDGVPLALPALVQAQDYQKRAARVGFDWADVKGVLDKLEEELGEVHAAQGDLERGQEIGDLLFAVVNLARWYGADAESVLREANARFYRRFTYIERTARSRGRSLDDLSMEEMESLWQEAKRDETLQ